MKAKVSKYQEEVWDAKEQLFDETKDLSMDKKLDYLHDKAKSIIEKYFKNKTVQLQIQ